MSNQNLNTLNVKTLNYTADHIYHRGIPVSFDELSGLWSKGAGNNIYYDKGNGTVSIGTTDTSGGLFILKPQHFNDYGPATFPPNLYLKANTTSNSTAVLKFSARYAGMYQCAPAYIWQGYRVGSTPGGGAPDPDTSDGRLCITANGYTSFILDGYNGYVGIGNRGQIPKNTLIPTQPLDVSGNTLIRGDLQVGIGNENRQLTLRCAASGTGNPNDASRNGLIIWDGPATDQRGGLFTALATDTNRSLFEFGLSYNQDPNSGIGPFVDVSNIIVLDSSGGGRVGIGTYQPTSTLDVSGNITATGNALIQGEVVVGSGSAAGVFKSNGNNDLTLQTGNTTTGSITIHDGAGGDIDISPNFNGSVCLASNLNVDTLVIQTQSTLNVQGAINCTEDATIHNDMTVGYGGGALSSNTVVGTLALNANTSGINNVATGQYALNKNTTANGNTAIGTSALQQTTDGSANVAIGYRAAMSNITGIGNTVVGYGALMNATGDPSHNTVIGYRAMLDHTNGFESICIGYNAQLDVLNPCINSIVIGAHAAGKGPNTVVIGNTDSSGYYYNATSAGGWTLLSDSRIKKNITDSDLGLDFINKLRPVKYNLVNPADWPEPLLENRFKGDNPVSRPKDNTSICDGLIAQEVEEALKQLGKTWSGHDIAVTDGSQGLAYSALTVPLVKAVQELTYKLAAVEARLTAAGL